MAVVRKDKISFDGGSISMHPPSMTVNVATKKDWINLDQLRDLSEAVDLAIECLIECEEQEDDGDPWHRLEPVPELGENMIYRLDEILPGTRLLVVDGGELCQGIRSRNTQVSFIDSECLFSAFDVKDPDEHITAVYIDPRPLPELPVEEPPEEPRIWLVVGPQGFVVTPGAPDATRNPDYAHRFTKSEAEAEMSGPDCDALVIAPEAAELLRSSDG